MQTVGLAIARATSLRVTLEISFEVLWKVYCAYAS